MCKQILTILIVVTSTIVFSGSLNAWQASEQTVANSLVYDFEDDDDRNFDKWPDHWQRRTGAGYPHYVKIGIEEEQDSNTDQANSETVESTDESPDRYLRIQLDGGAAQVMTPERFIDMRYSYYLECDVRTFETETAELNEAWVSVEFRDEEGRVKARFETNRVQHEAEYTRLRVGPMIVTDEIKCKVIVKLHVSPTRASDLYGGACFDNIELKPFPRLLIKSNQPYNVFHETEGVEITCRVSGVRKDGAKLSFQLIDAFGEPVGEPEIRLLVDTLVAANEDDDVGFGGQNFRTFLNELEGEEAYDFNRELTIRYRPPIKGQGYYRLKVKLLVGDEVKLERERAMAVISNGDLPADSSFGWTLPKQNTQTSLPHLTTFLRLSGVQMIKYPVWYGKNDNVTADWIAELADRLNVAGIDFVGMLDVPPEEHRDAFSRTDMRIASVMDEPELWQPAVNHVLTRLSLKIHYWQLGGDDDQSFVGFPDLYKKVEEIRETLMKYAKDIELGLCWNWLHYLPPDEATPWEFALHLTDPDLTASELEFYLKLGEEDPQRVWTTLQPLPRDQYDLLSRVRDLVGRMVQIKIAGSKGIVVRPFSDLDGLMTTDGNPTDLYVPFRTTSIHLAGMTYIGSLQLPNKSNNLVFSNGTTATMLVWNEKDVQEELYLGEDVTVVDVWGQETNVLRGEDGHRQVLDVTAWPMFVSGLDAMVTEFRLNLNFNRERLASVFGHRQMSGLGFQNSFSGGASGNMTIHNEQLWAKPIELRFKVSPNDRYEAEFPVVLRSFASTGVHPVRIDFVIDADRRYRFSVYRDIQVGHGLIAIQHTLEPLSGDAIRVRAELLNNSYDPVSFECMLLVPGQRRQRRQILRLEHGRETMEFIIRNASELAGKSIWIRAEEIRGARVLNHHFSIEDTEGSTNPE